MLHYENMIPNISGIITILYEIGMVRKESLGLVIDSLVISKRNWLKCKSDFTESGFVSFGLVV